jgi:hypothetical protein
MISSMLAFIASLPIAQRAAAPKPKPESEIDLAQVLIDVRIELAEARADGQRYLESIEGLSRALSATHAESARQAERIFALQRQLLELSTFYGGSAPMPAPVIAPVRETYLAGSQRLQAQALVDYISIPERSRQQLNAQQAQQQQSLLMGDPNWLRAHPEAAFRTFDCTCVPARSDAFRNQQANVG